MPYGIDQVHNGNYYTSNNSVQSKPKNKDKIDWNKLIVFGKVKAKQIASIGYHKGKRLASNTVSGAKIVYHRVNNKENRTKIMKKFDEFIATPKKSKKKNTRKKYRKTNHKTKIYTRKKKR